MKTVIFRKLSARLANGQAAEHVQCARDVTGVLLTEVRAFGVIVRFSGPDQATGA